MDTDAWDVFMTVSRDSGIVAAQCFEGPVRIVKCAVYLLFFLIILACALASKVSLLVMTTGAGDQRKVSLNINKNFNIKNQRLQLIYISDRILVGYRPCSEIYFGIVTLCVRFKATFQAILRIV